MTPRSASRYALVAIHLAQHGRQKRFTNSAAVQDARQKEACRGELTYVCVLEQGTEGWKSVTCSDGYKGLVCAKDNSGAPALLSAVGNFFVQ